LRLCMSLRETWHGRGTKPTPRWVTARQTATPWAGWRACGCWRRSTCRTACPRGPRGFCRTRAGCWRPSPFLPSPAVRCWRWPGRQPSRIRIRRTHGGISTLRSPSTRLAGDRRGEARARAKRAAAGLQMGRFVSAELEIEQALELARAIEDRLGELDMLTEIAEAYARAGRFEAAHHYASEAAGDGEALRQTLVHPALLSQFAAVQRRAYEVLVHALVQLGHTDEAWTAANRARARRFAELVQRSHADYRLFTEEETRRLETLRTQVATKASRRSDLLARRARDEAERVRRQLTPLLEELQALEQRRDTGVLAAAEAPTLEEFQAVVDDGSIVLDYFVGAMGSGVWAITHDGASFHPLPPQNELEASVLRTARALRGPTAPRPADVTELSRLLLAPAAAQLRAADRLVVIPDGALQYLPFVVLAPDDARDASPRQRSDTVGSEETIDADSPVHLPAAISYLPSAEALLALRENNPRNGSGIAVVADPIFSTDDQRVLPSWLASRGEQGKASRATGRDALAAVPRLPGTAVEAEAIRRAAGSATKVRTLLGGDANRSAVLEGGVEDVGVVHFATHGVLDLQEPSLSGLALSVVSANGVPELSVLRALDVMRLPLSADLVVLSGCDTAIGKDVRGEGMLSLSRAFFYAGARQVVSSLWRVPDEATALLMERFYEELLQHDAKPAEALRRAQRMVRKKWPHPRYWAAFVVQGDWEG
jgi:CHAT domain-containing protein